MNENKNDCYTYLQKKIINNLSFPQYIRAGAGTGKTEVLINKILYILKNNQNVSLENFGIITFTNKAADELTERLYDTLYGDWANNGYCENFMRKQAELTSMIDICTIHSFCESLLREYGLYINIPLNFKIKSFRKETNDILVDVVNEFYDKLLFDGIPQFRMVNLLDILLKHNSNRGFALDETFADKIRIGFDVLQENEFWKNFKTAYIDMYIEADKRISERKIQENILTPNDLILKTVKLLQNTYIAKKMASKYKYLFIDEFQDTNKDQFDLVNIFIKNGVNIFLVGDDKQSIYAFRGADVENSGEMQSIIKSLQCANEDSIYMNENFRTDKNLLAIINKIFETTFMFDNEKLKFPKEPLVFPENKSNSCSIDNCFEITYSTPLEKIIENIVNKSKFKYGDIAILCRRNYELNRISSELKDKGYPIEVVGGQGFYKAKEIIDTYKLFNAIINKDVSYKNELIFTDYYLAIKSSTVNIDFEQYISELETVFRRETVEEILTFIYEKSCIFEYYKEKKKYQAIGNLHKLKDISRNLLNKDNMQPIQFLDYLYIMISSGQEEDEADVAETERKNGVIRIYSIHKAKGLSFPVVIVPSVDMKLNRPTTKPKIILDISTDFPKLAFNYENVNNGLAPDKEYTSLLKSDILKNLEEEIRIFYVACTRAKHKLVLSTDKSMDEIKKTLNWNSNASIIKWLSCIDNGNFINSYKFKV